MMLNRFASLTPMLAATLLSTVLATSCGSPTDSGTPPFLPADGATDPAALKPANSAVAQEPGTAAANSLELQYLISPGRAGLLRLGMREAQLKKVVPAELLRATTYSDNGTQLPAYEMRDAQRPDAPANVLHMMPDSAGGYRLRRIRIYDPQYRTAEGIGVGSPFGAARQNLGLTRVRNTPAGFAAVSGEVKIAWVIDPNSLPDKHPAEMSSTDIPPAARITGVLLYQ
jgi:hypothetical protein